MLTKEQSRADPFVLRGQDGAGKQGRCALKSVLSDWRMLSTCLAYDCLGICSAIYLTVKLRRSYAWGITQPHAPPAG